MSEGMAPLKKRWSLGFMVVGNVPAILSTWSSEGWGQGRSYPETIKQLIDNELLANHTALVRETVILHALERGKRA